MGSNSDTVVLVIHAVYSEPFTWMQTKLAKHVTHAGGELRTYSSCTATHGLANDVKLPSALARDDDLCSQFGRCRVCRVDLKRGPICVPIRKRTWRMRGKKEAIKRTFCGCQVECT